MRLSDEEIFSKLKEIAEHYEDDEWTLDDLRCDLEEVFRAVKERK